TTPHGTALPFSLGVFDLVQTVEPPASPVAGRTLVIPASVTGVLEQRFGEDRYALDGKKGGTWQISIRSAIAGAPLDHSLALDDAAGKEIARADNLTGTRDTTLVFPVPADGAYQLAVTDFSGQSGSRTAAYHLQVEMAAQDFTMTVPEFLAVPLGGKI